MQRLGETPHLRLVGEAGDGGKKKASPKRERKKKERKERRFGDPLEAQQAMYEAQIKKIEAEVAVAEEKQRVMEENSAMIGRANELTRWTPGA